MVKRVDNYNDENDDDDDPILAEDSFHESYSKSRNNNDNDNEQDTMILGFSPPKNAKRERKPPTWLKQQPHQHSSTRNRSRSNIVQSTDEEISDIDVEEEDDDSDEDYVSETDYEEEEESDYDHDKKKKNNNKNKSNSKMTPTTNNKNEKSNNKKLITNGNGNGNTTKVTKQRSTLTPLTNNNNNDTSEWTTKPSKSILSTSSSSISQYLIPVKKSTSITSPISSSTVAPSSTTNSSSSNQTFSFERRNAPRAGRLASIESSTNGNNNNNTNKLQQRDFFDRFLYRPKPVSTTTEIPNDIDILGDTTPPTTSTKQKDTSKVVKDEEDEGQDGDEQSEEELIVNKKRISTNTNDVSFEGDTIPKKKSYFELRAEKQKEELKEKQKQQEKEKDLDVVQILNDLDQSTEEEEEEEEVIVKKQRKPQSTKVKNDTTPIVLDDEDEDTEPEDVDTTRNEYINIVDDDDKGGGDKSKINGKEKEEEEEEEEERDESESDYEAPSLDNLIDACERFSQRMLKILASCDTNNQQQKQQNVDEEDEDIMESHQIIAQPSIIKKTMRSYQLIGLNWMAIMYKEKINGILADEMGLGKTVQSISLLGHIFEKFNDKGPHLIIVPATTLSNWQRELESWCPTLKVYTYYGTAKEREYCRYELRKMTQGKDFNVIITTYNIMFAPIDRGFLKKYTFSYLVLDEAQNIKNSDSKRYKNLFKINSKHKLLLTGTPLQNNLNELWALLNFIMPHIFGENNNKFLQELVASAKEEQDNGGVGGETHIITRMKKILSPFILRRLKSEVSHELMPKSEILEFVEMKEKQKEFYQKVLAHSKMEWEKSEQQKSEQQEIAAIGGDKGKKRGRPKKQKDSDDDVDGELMEIMDDEDDVNTGKKGKGKGGKKDAQKKVSSGALVSNILMQLRKTVNHPLLCKRFYYTNEQVKEIIELLIKRDDEYIGSSKMEVQEEFEALSDYDIHSICKSRQEKSHLLDRFMIPNEFIFNSSAKCTKLIELIDKHREKSKILVFSQMTRVLDILEDVFDHIGLLYTRLDGQTPVTERQDIIDYFTNNDEVRVFLLSTLAGGLGINLISANIVIFYDMSFNPQVDRQAEDRAHRLGQTKEVIVYKLIANGGTVDNYMLDLSNSKKRLNDSMLEEGAYQHSSKLESKNILKLLHSILSSSSTTDNK